MSDRIVKKLEKKGIKLPISQKSIGLYNPYNISGNLLFISGRLAIVDGKL
ncbi:MAG: hypothetical protein HOI64_07865 [Rhodobiaceae bacterium]|jgi:hypothetical protein|nr:hypothetical protein [Rhodobiaceae bacterium]